MSRDVMDEIELGELRSLLHGAPDAATWEAVCKLVSGPGWAARVEEWGPYAAEIMDRGWPDALRVMRREWLLGTPAQGARLARWLAIKHAAASELRALVGRVQATAPRLHVLEVHVELKTAQLDGLLEAVSGELRELALVYPCRVRARSTAQRISAMAGQLRRLDYGPVYAGEDEGMREVEWPRLRVLGLRGYGALEPAHLGGWLERAPGLEELELSQRSCEEALMMIAKRELPALRALRLDSARISSETLDALERAPWLGQLCGGLYKGPYSRPYSPDAETQARIMGLHARMLAEEAP